MVLVCNLWDVGLKMILILLTLAKRISQFFWTSVRWTLQDPYNIMKHPNGTDPYMIVLFLFQVPWHFIKRMKLFLIIVFICGFCYCESLPRERFGILVRFWNEMFTWWYPCLNFRFSDIFMKRMKLFLIILFLGAIGSSAWFTILCNKYIEYNLGKPLFTLNCQNI